MSLPYSVRGHTDCDAPLGVVVHQRNGDPVRLPVIDDGLQLYERKVGPTAITRRAEVTVPIEGFGDDNWLSYIGAFSPDPSSDDIGDAIASINQLGAGGGGTSQPTLQIGDVIGQPIDGDGEPIGEPTVLFRGYVAAVGSKDGVNRAQFRIHDPSTFLDSIEAGEKFRKQTPSDVLSFMASEFQDEQPVFTDVTLNVAGVSDRSVIDSVLSDMDLGDAVRQAIADETIEDEFTFSPNRDTLADVLEWLTRYIDARVWFEPNGRKGITLQAAEVDSQQFNLTPDSTQPPFAIKNDVLAEIAPFNAVKVKGKAGSGVSFGFLDGVIPVDTTYPEAEAWYPPLEDRYGGRLAKTDTVETTSEDATAKAAETRLKELLDNVSGGEMVTTLATVVRPYDTLTATPACSGVSADVEALEYEVQEAVHAVTPSDNNLPQSTLSVSLSINPNLIESESTTKDARTGEKPSDVDPNDEYEYDYQTAP